MSRYDGRRYPSDLTDAQWAIVEPMVPKPSTQGRPPRLERRAIVNAILYVLRSGCPWRLLPLDFPAWQTVYYYFRRWQRGFRVESVTRHLAHADAREARPKPGTERGGHR